MPLSRRRCLSLVAGGALLPLTSHRPAWAETYPARPVRVLVGFAAGGTTDIGTRIVAQALSDRLGKQFVVENRPGAATNIATEAVVHAPADGYTLLGCSVSNAVNATLYEKITFNFARDIAMVSGTFRSPLVLEVNPSVPVHTAAELISYAKANPGMITLASFGTGTSSHATGELFKMMAGIDMVHVPYRGSGPMVVDLIGGQVQAAVDNLPASIEQIKAGKVRALAVTTAVRSAALPDVPTLAETLPGFEASAWIAIAAPRATPAEIVTTLNNEINAILADPGIKARAAELGATVFPGSAADLTAFLMAETEKWAKVVKFAGIKPE